MKKLLTIILGLAFIPWGATGARADTIALFDYGFNIDGSVSVPTLGDAVPVEADISGFDVGTGLGTISVGLTGAGAHFVALFVDHEIDEPINTFFNENGATSGTLAAGQSWEIDEPGFVFGDIFANFLTSALDGTNGVPAGLEDDVSMAMGFDFVLGAGDTATIDFLLSTTAPGSGFFLAHTDPASLAGLLGLTGPDDAVFFSASLDITPTAVPEPGTQALLGIALVALVGTSIWRKQRV